MSRIRKLYLGRWTQLLEAMGCPAAGRAADRLIHRVVLEAGRSGRSFSHQALAWEQRLNARLRRRVGAHTGTAGPSSEPPAVPPRFVCDAGLGGLARWLRAAGYQACWREGIHDADLVREAEQKHAVLLTTDSLLLERRAIRQGTLRAIWLSPAFTVEEQLAALFSELRLRPRPGRCMKCGGELQRTDRVAIEERIPPRTARWLDEYFVCRECGQLFWHGTHWRRIQARINRLAGHGDAGG